ncbi:Panacea domain-containing protein [Bathymodiolus thermophilus thioautotrophic gill symbiont]|uniref:Panacea domain-containing protein n=1 Tax=Bathymodiolus thermophilus thioautotrophic gill symbiont TaxID=2360 RepID=UPI001160C044|nr:Panacea domain-containing protein [Bathymodiolus thermophilus thioautotrophic gill symbiont]
MYIITSMLDELKISQVAGYVLSKEDEQTMSILKLMKLLYFIDRASLVEYGCPISYDSMVAMRFGMVLSNTYDLASGTIKSEPNGWESWVSDKENHNVSLKRQNVNIESFDELSEADIEIIDKVWQQYGNKNQWELADMQHDPKICPEWKDPQGSSMPVSYHDIFISIGLDKETASSLSQEIDKRNAINLALNA